MRPARLWLVWTAGLLGVWILYTGTVQWLELVAGTCAAAMAAAAQTVARLRGGRRFRYDPRLLASAVRVVDRLFLEFGVVVLALSHGRPHGRFRTIDFPAGGKDPRTAGRRALAAAAGTIPPNTIVLDVDRDRKLALVHDLDPSRAREELP